MVYYQSTATTPWIPNPASISHRPPLLLQLLSSPMASNSADSIRSPRFRPLLEARPRYPVWSVKPVTMLLVVSVALTAVLVLWLGRRPVVQELEITLGIVAGLLFVFLSVGLHRGVRLKEREPPPLEIPSVQMDADPVDAAHISDFGLGADGGCLGAIVGLLLSVLVAVVLLGLLSLFMQIAVAILAVLAAGLYWIFHLALRQVFAHSKDCHGRLARSLGFAAWYTILYTGWLFAVLLAAGYLTSRGS